MQSPRILALCIGLAGISVAGAAQAHAHLVSSTPAAQSTAAAPSAIVLRFSEKLVPAFSGLELKDAAGHAVATGKAPAPDDKSIAASVRTRLAPGAYKVDWHVASGDGHRMTGSYSFTVR